MFFCLKPKSVFVICFLWIHFLQSQNEWTWIKGNNSQGQKGIYGVKNISSPNNTPGARAFALSWTDLNGDFWLYGGGGKDSTGTSGLLSDMWKFDVAAKQWIWMSGDPLGYGINNSGLAFYGTIGVPSSSATPGFREASATWTDNNGNLWLFGGAAADTISPNYGSKNDLWKYDVTTNLWTWMNGPKSIGGFGAYGTKGVMAITNIPGARDEGMTTWKDNAGNLWLYGGTGRATSTVGHLNDLWKYDIAANQWTWMKGSAGPNQIGTYGTITVSNPSNTPGARKFNLYWTDKAGNFWLFGGNGYDVTSAYGDINDLWRYMPSTNEWTWMKGTKLKSQVPIYGTLNVAAASNCPSALSGGACWVDSVGNLWGTGPTVNSVSTAYYPSALWKYNIANNNWTWVKGSNLLIDQNGIYGIQNISAITNIPGGRSYQNCWSHKGELWMFGGSALATATCCTGAINDLWRFIPCYTNTILVANTTPAANYTLCNNGTTNLNASGTGTITWYDIYSNTVGSGTLFTTPTLTTNQTNPNLYTPYTFLFGDNTSCLISSITLSVYPNPSLAVTATPSMICAGSSSTLNAISPAAFYNWNTSQNTITISVSPTITSVYNVTVTNFPSGCYTTGSKTITVSACTGIEQQINFEKNISIYPNPNNGSFKLQLDSEIENGELILFNMTGQKVFSLKIKQGDNEIRTQGLAKGLYNYSIIQNKTRLQTGKIIFE
jgi:hypothetical protein